MLSNSEKAWLVVASRGQTRSLFESLNTDQIDRLARCVGDGGSYSANTTSVWREVLAEWAADRKAVIDED